MASRGRRAPLPRSPPVRSKEPRPEPVAGLEDPPHDGKAQRQKRERHGDADADVHVGDAVEAPAEAVDEINDRIELRHGLPERRQHTDGIEGAAEERQRRQHEHRYGLQLLEAVGPDADDEAEQAERHGDQYEKGEHPDGMRDLERYEQARRGQDDDPSMTDFVAAAPT